MSVSCNDCSTKVDRLKTGWELLGQGNVVPDKGDCNVTMILIIMVSVIASLIMIITTFVRQQDALLWGTLQGRGTHPWTHQIKDRFQGSFAIACVYNVNTCIYQFTLHIKQRTSEGTLVTSESCQICLSSWIGKRDFSKNSFAWKYQWKKVVKWKWPPVCQVWLLLDLPAWL